MEPVSSHSGHKIFLGFCQILSNSFPTTQNPWYLGIGFTLAALLLAVYQEDHQAWPLRFSDTLVTLVLVIGHNVKTPSPLWALQSEVTQNSQCSSNSNGVWGAYVQCGCTFRELVSSHSGHKKIFGFCQILSNSFHRTQNPRYLGIGFTLVAVLLAVYQEYLQAQPLRFSWKLVTLSKSHPRLWALQSEVTQNSHFLIQFKCCLSSICTMWLYIHRTIFKSFGAKKIF